MRILRILYLPYYDSFQWSWAVKLQNYNTLYYRLLKPYAILNQYLLSNLTKYAALRWNMVGHHEHQTSLLKHQCYFSIILLRWLFFFRFSVLILILVSFYCNFATCLYFLLVLILKFFLSVFLGLNIFLVLAFISINNFSTATNIFQLVFHLISFQPYFN